METRDNEKEKLVSDLLSDYIKEFEISAGDLVYVVNSLSTYLKHIIIDSSRDVTKAVSGNLILIDDDYRFDILPDVESIIYKENELVIGENISFYSHEFSDAVSRRSCVKKEKVELILKLISKSIIKYRDIFDDLVLEEIDSKNIKISILV